MVLIAHRGNIAGPNPEHENRNEYIRQALESGYDVEVDAWYTDCGWFLGHDGPAYHTWIEFLQNPSLWVHAKNVEALEALIANKRVRTFWHDKDVVTLTSDNYIWGFRGGSNRSIIVVQDDSVPKEKCYGICSDYVEKIKTTL